MQNLLLTSVTHNKRVDYKSGQKIITLESFLNSIANEDFSEVIGELKNVGYDEFKDESNEEIRTKKISDAQQKFKVKYLPSIRIGGEFKGLKGDTLTSEPTNLLIVDIDHIASDEQQLNAMKLKFILDKKTLFCFVSPRRDGLKIGIRLKYHQLETEWENYKKTIIAYYEKMAGVEVDSGKIGINAPCFYSSDPDVFVRENCEVFEYDMPVEPVVEVAHAPVAPVSNAPVKYSKSKQKFIDRVNELIDTLGPRRRNNNCNEIGNKIGGAFTSGMLTSDEYEDFRSIVLGKIAGMQEHINTFNNACEYGKLHPKLAKWVEHKPKNEDDTQEVQDVESILDPNTIDYSKPVLGETPNQRWEREKLWRKSKVAFFLGYGTRRTIDIAALKDYYESLPIATSRDIRKVNQYFHVTKDSLKKFEGDEKIENVIYDCMIEDGISNDIADEIFNQHATYNIFYLHKSFRVVKTPPKKTNTFYHTNCSVTVTPKKLIINPIDTRFYYYCNINDKPFKAKRLSDLKQRDTEMVIKGFCSDNINGEWVLNNNKYEYFLYEIGKFMTTDHDGDTRADDGSGKMCLLIIDNHVNKPKGGTAKSALLRMFSKIQHTYAIDGKDFEGRFPLDGYNPEFDQAINVQDAEPSVMRVFYNFIGEDVIQFNAKHKQKINLRGDDLFNIFMTSNYLPDGYILDEDDNFDLMNSTNRRTNLLIISDYWKNHNHNLSDVPFLKWKTDAEWNDFYNYIYYLTQEYMNNKGKKNKDWEYSSMNELKSILGKSEVASEVVEFIESYVRRKDVVVDIPGGNKKIKIWKKNDEGKRFCSWELLCKTFFTEYPDSNIKNTKILFKEIQKFFKYNTKDKICGKTSDVKRFFYKTLE